MEKIGLLNKEKYKLDSITKSTAMIPIIQVHILLMLGLFLGGGVFLVALLTNADSLASDIERIPKYVLMMIAGWMVFSLFVPMAYIVYLFKEVQLLKDEMDNIQKGTS
ncbi:MAG: hypothetical protein ACYSU8_07895 [Planctomycetota bacterium]|jgi:TRAP-type C4-dicarboxylate transport system permease small subunit